MLILATLVTYINQEIKTHIPSFLCRDKQGASNTIVFLVNIIIVIILTIRWDKNI